MNKLVKSKLSSYTDEDLPTPPSLLPPEPPSNHDGGSLVRRIRRQYILESELHELQYPVFTCDKRFVIVDCGRRWGKSVVAKTLLAHYALSLGQKAAYMCPTYKMLEDFWTTTKTMLAPMTKEANVQNKRIVLKTGGIIDFWSADNYDAIRGRSYDLFIFDEAALINDLENCWTQAARATLADRQGRAYFFSTPKGENFFKTLYDRGAAGEPDYASFTYPTSTNPYIAKAEIESAKRELPELVFRQEFLAEFVTLSGTAFKDKYMIVEEPPPAEELDVYVGVDLAISQKQGADYTAMVAIGRERNKSGKIWVLDAFRVRASFNDIVGHIVDFSEKNNAILVAVETVQFQASVVQELLRTTTLNVRAVRPDKDKVTRSHSLVARYEQGLVYHTPDLASFFTTELLAFPHGKHDDIVDALVYAYNISARGSGGAFLLNISEEE